MLSSNKYVIQHISNIMASMQLIYSISVYFFLLNWFKSPTRHYCASQPQVQKLNCKSTQSNLLNQLSDHQSFTRKHIPWTRINSLHRSGRFRVELAVTLNEKGRGRYGSARAPPAADAEEAEAGGAAPPGLVSLLLQQIDVHRLKVAVNHRAK